MIAARESISDRIFSTFPSGNYCLPALMRVLDVVESTAVETACVQCTARPRMFINPKFVEEHAGTPEKLLMLVLHELHHVMLGHTRLFPRVTQLDNLVFDAVINAMLCRMLPGIQYTAMFRDYYDEAAFPACFLRPPVDWQPTDTPANVRLPRALQGTDMRGLAALYRELYGGRGATYDELRSAFSSFATIVPFSLPQLLGDHGPEGDGSSSDGALEHRSPLLIEELRRITEVWPTPPNPTKGRSLSELLRDSVKKPARSNRSRLVELLRAVGALEGVGRIPHVHRDVIGVVSPIPQSDRRTLVQRALGARPMLFHREVNVRRVRMQGTKVHIYLDVSGSVRNMTGALYGAVLACQEFVHPVVHLFSTKVADVTLAALRRGVCESTGGTSIDCVTQHMRDNRVKRAAIITDGFVGHAGIDSANVFKTVTVGVALTPGWSTRTNLEAHADHWIELGDLNSCT